MVSKANDLLAKAKSGGKVTDVVAKGEAKPEYAPKDGAKLHRHPLSEKYGPPISPEEQLAMTTSIKEHGQHDPIITYEGKVLSGWTRYMGCLQSGVKPKIEPYRGDNPEAVAFETNTVRRKLTSVQKAMMGALYCVSKGEHQEKVAKIVSVNLNRLNQCCQLLASEVPAHKKLVEKIRATPDMTGPVLEELLVEAGIIRPTAAQRAEANADFDEGEDITGGLIDDNDGDDEDDDLLKPKQTVKAHTVGGDGPISMPTTGSKRTSQTNPHETPVSRLGGDFKKLSPAEQRQFVKVQWSRLKTALDAAITAGEVDYTPPARKVDPSLIARPLKGKAEPKKKGKAEPEKKPAAKKAKAEPEKKPKGKAEPEKKPAAKKGKSPASPLDAMLVGKETAVVH